MAAPSSANHWPRLLLLLLATLTTPSRCHGYDWFGGSTEVPPVFLEGPPPGERYMTGEEELSLPCLATGNPTPTVELLHNGTVLEPSRTVIYDDVTGEFFLERPLAGSYQCVAKNDLGVAVTNITVLKHTELRFTEIHEGSCNKPYEVSAREGELITLRCGGFHSQPQPSYRWHLVPDSCEIHNRRPVRPSATVGVDTETGTLVITHLLKTDAPSGKLFQCKITNSVLRQSLYGPYYRVHVKDDPQVDREKWPSILDALSSQRNLVAIQGDSTTLTCFFRGWPTPEITWVLHRGESCSDVQTIGEHLTPSRHFRLLEKGRRLRLSDLQLDMEGCYRCIADESQPRRFIHRMDLQIESVPAMDEEPTNQNVTLMSSASFTCRAVSRPSAQITWYLNGRKVDESLDKWYVNSSDQALYISNITLDDTAVITCNASNSHGYVLRNAYLLVKNISLPAETTTVTTVTTTPVTVPTSSPALKPAPGSKAPTAEPQPEAPPTPGPERATPEGGQGLAPPGHGLPGKGQASKPKNEVGAQAGMTPEESFAATKVWVPMLVVVSVILLLLLLIFLAYRHGKRSGQHQSNSSSDALSTASPNEAHMITEGRPLVEKDAQGRPLVAMETARPPHSCETWICSRTTAPEVTYEHDVISATAIPLEREHRQGAPPMACTQV